MRDAKLDGWLFYDFRHSDPLAYRILKLDEKMFRFTPLVLLAKAFGLANTRGARPTSLKAGSPLPKIFPLRQRTLKQNGDELPGASLQPAARFILVRFYGLRPLR